MTQYVMAIDQGTTSTRAMLFNHAGEILGMKQKEHEQFYPKPGWVEHDPLEIWSSTQFVLQGVLNEHKLTKEDLIAIGITNQRETMLVWNKEIGKPYYPAIVWQDTRTDMICNALAKEGGLDSFRQITGLPLATYFSGPKISWMLETVPGLREDAKSGKMLFGTIDTWLVWNLTGGVDGGLHLTDVTNASRTLMMDLHRLNWDQGMLDILSVPKAILPKIVPSSSVYGEAVCVLEGVPVAGILGDQQAALFGQACSDPGEAKNTYGTGCFMLMNTGKESVPSKCGLLTTIGYKIGEQPVVYALEGSIAITGALVQWLRDNLRMIDSAPEIEALAKNVDDTGGIYFVPAFSGLFAPYWRSDARGVIVGLTRFINRGHIARAVLEATAYQVKEVLDAMEQDSGVKLQALKVDGGMVVNDLLMQFQADILDVPVIRPVVAETNSLGAAYAAGLAVGFWEDVDSLRKNWREDKRWISEMPEEESEKLYKGWKKAVTRTFDWVEQDGE
jgi:glycerol kinase